MLNTNIVTIREVLRNHKRLLERVKKTKMRVTVVSQDHPQVGIVSLDDLKRLDDLDKQAKYQQSTKSLLEVAKKVREVLRNEKLPEDLSTRHDYYHYEGNQDE